jgi:hypothetical protein
MMLLWAGYPYADCKNKSIFWALAKKVAGAGGFVKNMARRRKPPGHVLTALFFPKSTQNAYLAKQTVSASG